MISIFLELPFQRQVKKIYTARFTELLKNAEQFCLTNGGSFFSQSNKYYFYFSSEVLAHEFSSVRFLFLLHGLLTKNAAMIESYRIIIDKTANTFDEIELENHFDKTRNILIDENSFYVTNRAYQTFSDYVKLENTSAKICKIEAFTIFEVIEKKKHGDKPIPSIVLHKNDSFFWVIYNFILQNPISDQDLKYLTNDEKYSFNQVRMAMQYFKKHRFEKELPDYFTDAFLVYTSLYFKIYKQKNHDSLPIIYSGDLRNEQLNAEIQKILTIIPEAEVRELSKKLPSIAKIADDMLSLVFLTTIFSKFLFIDELTEFLTSLNKSPEFFSDLCAWLYANDVIFEPNNLYAHSTHLVDFVESKVGEKTQMLYDKLSAFLISKYRAGEISPSVEFVEIINTMHYKQTDMIRLAIFLHTSEMQNCTPEDIENKFHDTAFFTGLQHYQKAQNFFINFDDSKALDEIKLAISEFKYHRFSVGEYKAMFFLGMFSLRKSHISDAINYFSYALDTAHKINDAEFLCEVIFHISVAYFLKNDLSLALNNLKKLDETIEKNFAQNWKVRSLFMTGRVYAQMGEYTKAEEFFTTAKNFSEQYFMNLLPMCDIWRASMLPFRNQNIQAQKIFEKYAETNFDAVTLFLAGLCITPVLKDETEKILSTEIASLPYEKILPTVLEKIEQSDETISGFSFAEDLTRKTKTALTTAEDLFQMFLLYYQCTVFSLGVSLSENKQKLDMHLKKMNALANKSVTEKNIYAHWYFYFCYDISAKLNGENSSEAISYLGKSFKLLQSRVMLTNENDVRDKYMKKNFWNAKILDAAKKQKLL